MFRKSLKKLFSPLLKRLWAWYSARPRRYRYGRFSLIIPSGVFHPALFFSTQFLLESILKEPIRDKKIWELGCGSGLISLVCVDAGAKVWASDVSLNAVEGLRANALRNEISPAQLQVICTDLFENMPSESWDYILVNPPYYPQKPQTEAELAFYCGDNFEYFRKFFEKISTILTNKTQVWMILSEDCNLFEINKIANQNHFSLQEIYRKNIKGEQNFIYKIVTFLQ